MPSQEVYSELMRQITSLLLFLAGLLLLAAPAAAIAPPRVIAERNLEANIILVGEVLEVIQSSPAHFELKVIHVIKGFERIKEGKQIKTFLLRTIERRARPIPGQIYSDRFL
ncbi:MAG: hypothetical protein KKD12_03800 [Proteobacteria bacterium]|nr:hypothetical protein [Pseudomonadota bacterium]